MAVVEDNKSTRIVSLTATGTNIVAHSHCKRITVKENFTSAAGATTDLGKTAPLGAGEVIVLKGTSATFTAPGPNGAFSPGTIVGKIKVLDVAGPVSGQQTEDQSI